MTTKMRDAMELVASRVDELGKSKIIPQPNQATSTTAQTTTTAVQPQPAQSTSTAVQSKPKPRKKKAETAYAEWDSRKYKGTETQRRLDREQQRLIREAKQKEAEEELARKVQALQPLGEDDEQEDEEAPPEPDPPAPPVKPSTSKESAAAKNK